MSIYSYIKVLLVGVAPQNWKPSITTIITTTVQDNVSCAARVGHHHSLRTYYQVHVWWGNTAQLFLKYLSYMTKTTQEESWVSQTKETPKMKCTVGERWEKNVCKHRRHRFLSSSLVPVCRLSSGCTERTQTSSSQFTGSITSRTAEHEVYASWN